jgi:hypothetical protein
LALKCGPLVLLPLVLTLGCATRLDRGPLAPIPQAVKKDGQPYAQAREYGRTRPLRWVLWSFDEVHGRSHPAVTVDFRNVTQTPVSIELARARIVYEVYGAESVISRARTSGVGNLPSTAPRGVNLPPALVLAPGAEKTVWLVFERPPDRESPDGKAEAEGHPRTRTTLVIPVAAQGDLNVPLFETAASPKWSPVERPAINATFALGVRGFRKGGHSTYYEVGHSYSHDAFSVGAQLGMALVNEPSSGAATRISRSLGLELRWRPPSWTTGAFASVYRMYVLRHDEQDLPRRKFSALSTGLDFPINGGLTPLASMRIAYMRVLGDVHLEHGLLFALSVKMFSY